MKLLMFVGIHTQTFLMYRASPSIVQAVTLLTADSKTIVLGELLFIFMYDFDSTERSVQDRAFAM